MKKNLLALSIAVAIASVSTAYAAVPNTATLGVRGGFTFGYENDNLDYNFSDDSGYGYGIYAGYDFTSWFGIEAGYNYYDGMELNRKDDNAKASLRVTGPELALRFAYPFDTKGSDIFFKAGGMYATSKTGFDDDTHQFAPLLGVGVQYVFDSGIGLRAGYDHYFNAYEADSNTYGTNGLDMDMGFAYVGFQYRFGGSKAPTPVVQEPVQQTPEKIEFVLDAKTLFAFDSAKLSDEGSQAISTMVTKANDKLENVSYEVRGYTDRLGATEYNQKLSDKRAQAVATSLRDNGVADTSITAKGYGESNSVTQNKCDGLKGNTLIECLAPDRRVEVTVQGLKNAQ